MAVTCRASGRSSVEVHFAQYTLTQTNESREATLVPQGTHFDEEFACRSSRLFLLLIICTPSTVQAS
jgi:hypothetical protein